MRFVVSLWFVFLCMLIACGSADAKSSRFTHPAYAYSLVPPQDYAVRPFVDALGIPYYVLTDERSAGAAAITRGVWITAYPIPTDDELDAKTVAPLLTALMAVGAPGLKIDAARTPTKLGAMDAVSMDVGGTHGKGAWRGRIVLAVQADNVLVVRYGAPAAQFDGLRPRFEAVLASIEAPLPFRPIRFGETGPLPEEKARALLRQCTPRVRVFARRDVKDPATATIDFASGTGFLFHPAGYVMTNRHVVETNTVGNLTRLCYDPVELVFDASLKIPPQRARVVAVSQQWDLALLRIEGDRTWPVVPLADPARVRPDHELLVAGWPEPQKYGTKGVNIAKGKVIG
ncbi:MAG: serine protease, partial [Planctomycetota bacterium]